MDLKVVRVNLVSLLRACSPQGIPMATQQRPHICEKTELPLEEEVPVSGQGFVLYGHAYFKFLCHTLSK